MLGPIGNIYFVPAFDTTYGLHSLMDLADCILGCIESEYILWRQKALKVRASIEF